MSAKVSTWLNKIGRDRWAALARALGVTVAYWLFYFSVGLPVGLGFFVFARRFLYYGLRDVTSHMEDMLLYLHAIAMLLVLLGVVVVIVVMLRGFDRSGTFSDLGFKVGKTTWLAVTISIGAAVGLVVLIFLVSRIAGFASLINTPPGERLWRDIFNDFIGYLLLLAATAVTEELIFRGYVRFTLEKVFSAKLVLLVSALLFGLSRLVMVSSGLLGLVSAIFAGLILGMLYLVTGSLWVPIAAHFAWIFTESYIFSFPSHGIVPEGLLRLKYFPGLLLDGSYGPQAGLLALGIFVVVAVCLWLFARKRLQGDARTQH
jgi:membrane protease YdiL (CAAX protease family)